jgi:seryl-tRNA synthetase
MPTNTESIRELEKAEVALRTRLQGVEKWEAQLNRLAEEIARLSRELIEKSARLTQDVAVLNEKASTHDKQIDRMAHQRFTIWIAIASAVGGAALTFGSQLIVRFLVK